MSQPLETETIPLYTRVQKLCEERHITICYLEQKAEIGNGVIRKWNTASPTLRTLLAVANVLGVTLDELIRA